MQRQTRSLVLAATLLLLLSSCANAPYIMEGMARGLAESSYQLEMEQRRQRQIAIEQSRFNHEFRQRMYRYQLREQRRQRYSDGYRSDSRGHRHRRKSNKRRH